MLPGLALALTPLRSVRYLPLLERYSIVLVGRVPQPVTTFGNYNGSARKTCSHCSRNATPFFSTPPRSLMFARLALPLGASPLPTSPRTILNRSRRQSATTRDGFVPPLLWERTGVRGQPASL